MATPRLHARPPADPAEQRTLRKLAAARQAPASWVQRARIITGSWDGASVTELALRLGCTTKTVYKWLHRFNTLGIDGLADAPRSGIPRRISEHDRGRIIALARSAPPGRLVQGGEGLMAPSEPTAPAVWTLDALTDAAQAQGIRVARSQVRRILLAEGLRWRRTRSWITSPDPARSRLRPKRAQVIACYTDPPPEVTVICADELGPVIPRTFAPAPGWTADGHRVKAVLDYGRGPEKTWVYGALRPRDGQTVTLTAPSRNSVGYQQLLAAVEAATPTGALVVITDNLSSHSSCSTRTWLTDHPRIRQVFIPKAACWLNLQEGWWRLFRRTALAGQSFATPDEITLATRIATAQLNTRAQPWIWGRPAPPARHLRRRFTYRI